MASQSPKPGHAPGHTADQAGKPADLLIHGLDTQKQLVEIFDVLVNVMFCIKNRDNRYVAVNAAFVRRTGRRSKREVIGRMANQLFSPELAERYEEQDAAVFASGKALRDELELIRRPDGSLGWYLTTKLPISGEQSSNQPHGGERGTIGIVSVSRDLETPSGEGIAVASLTKVVELVSQRLSDRLRVSDLASAAQCSTSQLGRRMKRVFGLTPTQYVLRVRVDRAAELLITSDAPVAEVASSCGFYDQADLTRKFARLTNETPAKFRAINRANGQPT